MNLKFVLELSFPAVAALPAAAAAEDKKKNRVIERNFEARQCE